MAEFAVNASVPQLRRSLTKYSFDPPAATGQDNAATGDNTAGDTEAGDTPSWNGFALVEDRASAPAQLSISHDQWGRLSLRFTAPADQDAFRTHNHLDTAGGWLTGRPRLPKHLADKLTRDGIPQPLRLTAGAPVNVGRAQRIVPARTRRLVEDRDRGCRFPGCNATAHLQCHHLTHWADGGPTDTANLACPCPYHHDSHHDSHHNGTFTVAGNANDPDGLTFTTNGGFPIRPGPTFTTPHPTAATTPATRCTGVTHTATTDSDLPRTHRRNPQPPVGHLRQTPNTRALLTTTTSRLPGLVQGSSAASNSLAVGRPAAVQHQV